MRSDCYGLPPTRGNDADGFNEFGVSPDYYKFSLMRDSSTTTFDEFEVVASIVSLGRSITPSTTQLQ